MLGMMGVMALAACSSPAEPPSRTAQTVAVEATATDAAPAAPETVHMPAPTTAPRACMIAGEFKLMGQVIRSRDCMQIAGSSTEAELQRACEGLAQTSAQMGGKAGEITYMDGCPSPAQGSCKNLFGKTFDGFYYERSAEDVAGLPASCALGGGTWVAG
jgi:hypothetical protein